ncbi:hypothetical protein ACHAW5_001699 [Stephanodiscus triporus]|uniref:Uncharacterized protein n=1 Tax=Stephanodiscus triporus TaxID=2934178 RepID=A0ABD3MVM9_9STRA
MDDDVARFAVDHRERRRREEEDRTRSSAPTTTLSTTTTAVLPNDAKDGISIGGMMPEEITTRARRRRKTRATQFVAKTVESFKLADLYWLESRVISYYGRRRSRAENGTDIMSSSDWSWNVSQLAFHRPTASHLLCWYYNHVNGSRRDNGIAPDDTDYFIDGTPGESSTVEKVILPFRPGRSQYAARILAMGQSPRQLLDDIIVEGDSTFGMTTSWTLEYDTFEPLRDNEIHPGPSFSRTMLLCAASRAIPGEPSLTSFDNHSREGRCASYVIIETSERLYLAQKLSHEEEGDALHERKVPLSRGFGSTHAVAGRFRSTWARRPFQYSGAIDLDAALVIVDLLMDSLRGRIESKATIRILDPTCGSGTFLALALMAWGDEESNANLEVTGIDSNPKCSRGTIQNLKHLFPHCTEENSPLGLLGDDDVRRWTLMITNSDPPRSTGPSSRATIYADDSCRLQSFVTGEKFDCAVANLPWNRNTFEFQGRSDDKFANDGILWATAAALRPGSPLVVVSGGHRDEKGGGGQTEEGGPEISFNARERLVGMGFVVLGEASIPPRGFQLPPASGKKRNSPGLLAKNGKVQRNSDCWITVAIAPKEISQP